MAGETDGGKAALVRAESPSTLLTFTFDCGDPMKLGNLGLFVAAALVLAGMAQAPAHANSLVNPGFEDPITYDGPPFVGSWEGFNGGGAAVSNSTLSPHSGIQHLSISINSTANTFAGAFQDVASLTPGDAAVFSGWHMTPSNPLDLGVEIRIEWRNSVSNTEVSRTANLTPTPTGTYTPFSLSAVVPAGADAARVVYAIQSFSSAPLGNGTVYVDDVSFVSGQATPSRSSTWGRLKGMYR